MHFNIIYAVGLFFLAMLLDAVYTFSVIKHKALMSGAMGGLIYILSAVGVVSYVNNKLYLIPLALGAFVGTVIVVEYEKRKNIKV